MSHHIYTTPGFVLESHPNGEAGKFIHIFSRDLGMISGVAQGIRLTQSKLRYHAQDFSLANFSLVRGKEVWRIVGVEHFSSGNEAGANLSPLFVRIVKTVKRLVAGEEKNEGLFEVLFAAHAFLQKNLGKEEEQNAEYIIMLRILHNLGYVRTLPSLAPFLSDNSYSQELLGTMTPLRPAALKEINTALKESHL